MIKISKKISAAVILIFGAAVILAARFVVLNIRKKSVQPTLTRVRGNPAAPIKIEEYIDFQCPACAFGASYLKNVMEDHPDAIYLELRHFPLSMHKYGFLSAQYAECAGEQGEFWPYVDILLARQKNWERLEDARPAFDQIAKDIDLDVDRLRACVDDGKINKLIDDQRTEGQILQIKSTPTYFVNGKMVVGGNNLMVEVNQLLEKNGIK